MHRVVSVSLGSSKRDAKAEFEVLGEKFLLERIGTDGSLEKAGAILRELDGKVAAFGLGGTDLYIVAGNRRYSFADIKKLAQNAKITPIVDGSGLKHTLEREAIRHLEPIIGWENRKTLMVSAVDRFGMAESLSEAKADVLYGDLIFSLGLPIPLKSFNALKNFAYIVLPIVTKLPFQWFYPTGDKQERFIRDWRQKYYQWAEVIAGDFLYINRFRPERLDEKTILTQTITEKDAQMLKQSGLKRLITTTPKLNGRNFATNAMEGFFIALSGKNRALTENEYLEFINKVDFKPEIYELN